MKSITAAGLLVLAAVGRSWGVTGFGPGQSMAPAETLKEARASVAPAAPQAVPAGNVEKNNPEAGKPDVPVEWVSIKGGSFWMGSDEGRSDAKPVHMVNIKTFEISKTLVTVAQYAECVSQGGCTEPRSGELCNWGQASRQYNPVNCVNWEQANQYAKFKGARLPTESEWEYAAKSGGKSQKYPWGNEDATCKRAVMNPKRGLGFDGGGTMPVCSKPAGNTAQGLCDMAGNVWEWVQDKYHDSYAGAPTDGSAFEAPRGSARVMRGGGFQDYDAGHLRADFRGVADPDLYGISDGIRIVRSIR